MTGAVNPLEQADAVEATAAGDLAWSPGTGPGTLVREEGDRLTVLPEREGYRTPSLAAVQDGGLLRHRGAGPRPQAVRPAHR